MSLNLGFILVLVFGLSLFFAIVSWATFIFYDVTITLPLVLTIICILSFIGVVIWIIKEEQIENNKLFKEKK